MELINQLCGSLHEVYGATKKHIKISKTETKIFRNMKTEIKECKTCNGSGETELSPCCQSDYDSDTMMCHECDEHIGEDDLICEDCNGTGVIKSNPEEIDPIRNMEEHEALEAIRRADLYSSELTEDDYIQDI